eukprot:395045_1
MALSEIDQKQNDQAAPPHIQRSKIVIILTGATGVIGSAIAADLASKPNVSLHLLVRNEQKAQILIKNTLKKRVHKTSTLQYHLVDLSSKTSLTSFVATFCKQYSYLDVLINNAAIVPNTYNQTSDGEELQFAVNVMSYMRLMIGLSPLLISSGKCRKETCAKVVNVSSQYTTTLTNNPSATFNLSPKDKSKYYANEQYQKSKTANRMITYKASQLWNKQNIGVYSCHPGVITSNVLTGLGWTSARMSAEQCAQTPLFLAMDSR